MPDDTKAQCDALFMACAPFARAEQEAEDRLKEARAAFRLTRRGAAAARRAWVENILKHDHRGLCLKRPQAAPGGPREGFSDV